MSQIKYDTFTEARVRIDSCSNPRAWYANLIGEEFDVQISPKEHAAYIVDDGPGIYRMIQREDATIIEGEDDEDKDALTLIANMAVEVAQLKARVKTLENENRSLERDLRTWAERMEEVDYKAGQALTSASRIDDVDDKTEMLIDDVVMLDERTRDL